MDGAKTVSNGALIFNNKEAERGFAALAATSGRQWLQNAIWLVATAVIVGDALPLPCRSRGRSVPLNLVCWSRSPAS
jgi:hypothetical protein